MTNQNQTSPVIAEKQKLLIFKRGTYRNKNTGTEIPKFISKLFGKIVYADIKLDLITGVSYTCDLSLSEMGKAYEVITANKTPVIKQTLHFKRGEKRHNPKNNTWVQNSIAWFDGRTVIASETIVAESGMYDCELVLSPTGKAYIAEKAVPAAQAPPSTARIMAHEYPLSIVEVIIDGNQQDNLKFDCMGGDEKILAEKIRMFRQMNISDKGMIISNYEATCKDLMNKHLSKIQ